MTAYKIQVDGYEVEHFEYCKSPNRLLVCVKQYVRWQKVDLSKYLERGEIPFKYSWQDENTGEWCVWMDDAVSLKPAYCLDGDFYLIKED